MAQTCRVIQADPNTLAAELTALNEDVTVVEKTSSAGKFIVVSEAPSSGQTFVVIAGDPDTLSGGVNALITGGANIDLIVPTFSASHYVVVYK